MMNKPRKPTEADRAKIAASKTATAVQDVPQATIPPEIKAEMDRLQVVHDQFAAEKSQEIAANLGYAPMPFSYEAQAAAQAAIPAAPAEGFAPFTAGVDYNRQGFTLYNGMVVEMAPPTVWPELVFTEMFSNVADLTMLKLRKYEAIATYMLFVKKIDGQVIRPPVTWKEVTDLVHRLGALGAQAVKITYENTWSSIDALYFEEIKKNLPKPELPNQG